MGPGLDGPCTPHFCDTAGRGSPPCPPCPTASSLAWEGLWRSVPCPPPRSLIPAAALGPSSSHPAAGLYHLCPSRPAPLGRCGLHRAGPGDLTPASLGQRGGRGGSAGSGAGGRYVGFSVQLCLWGFIPRKWKKALILISHDSKAFLNIISFHLSFICISVMCVHIVKRH